MFCASVTSVAFGRTHDRPTHFQRMQHASKGHLRRTATNNRAAQLTSLITELRTHGVTAKRAVAVSQPFFAVKGQVVSINGETVQIFVYLNAKAAENDASHVSSTWTSVGTSMLSWLAPPHFYRRNNLIALYVGQDATINRALESVLGPQFAGG